MTTSERFAELMECFRKPFVPGEQRCGIVDADTYWEGERWTETHKNGNSMTIGGMTIPLSTQFVVCKDHEP
jgi:hypothetical protein